MVKAKVETTKTLPDAFRPVHGLDTLGEWEGVRIRVRGLTGVVRGAIREHGTIRLFVKTEHISMYVTPEEVEIMPEETTIVDDGIDHSQEVIADEEPEGGWVTADTKLTGEVFSLILCKYSGQRPVEAILPGTLQCQARVLGNHRDEQCFMRFYSAAALLAGAVEVGGDDVIVAQETVRTGDEITYVNPIA